MTYGQTVFVDVLRSGPRWGNNGKIDLGPVGLVYFLVTHLVKNARVARILLGFIIFISFNYGLQSFRSFAFR